MDGHNTACDLAISCVRGLLSYERVRTEEAILAPCSGDDDDDDSSEEPEDAGLNLDLEEIANNGSMTKEEKEIAKWLGIYSSRQPGNHMCRVVVAGGTHARSSCHRLGRRRTPGGR